MTYNASVDQEEEEDLPPFLINPGPSAHQWPEGIYDPSSRPNSEDPVPPQFTCGPSGKNKTKCSEANDVVLDAFMGLPPQEDPYHVRLRRMAQQWPKRCFILRRFGH